MVEQSLSAVQRRAGYGLMAAVLAGFAWAACPGVPAWGPRACPRPGEAESRASDGQDDGPDLPAAVAARPPAVLAQSCVACHSQGGPGGGGLSRREVLAAEGPAADGRPLPRRRMMRPVAGEGRVARPRPLLPVGLRFLDARPDGEAPTASVNAPALFGLGLIDRLPARAIREPGPRDRPDPPALGPAGPVPGRSHVLPDGRVGRFGRKAQFATLAEFLDAGCASAAAGRAAPAPADRLRPALALDRWRHLVAFVDSLARPRTAGPDSVADAGAARRGEAQFAAVGCTACHTADLGGLAGVYGDFRLHRLDDRGDPAATPTPDPTADPLPDEWRTAPLWGVADSAPYLHDGSAPTLEAAIARHRGDAEAVTRAYEQLDEADRGDLVAFLRTLKVPVPGSSDVRMAASVAEQPALEVAQPSSVPM